MLNPSADRIRREITAFSEIGRTEEGGVSRFAFTPDEVKSRRRLMERMESLGMSVKVDSAGNILGIRSGRRKGLPVVLMGSHLDTVINGGWFDGAAGVICGLEVIERMNLEGITTENPVGVISFTNEEGIRFPPMIGSAAAAGIIGPDDLYRLTDRDGITFRDALAKAAHDPSTLAPVPFQKGSVKAYLELHIEQGPVLERESLPIGVVDTITGYRHMRLVLKGRPDHAGTTPMGMRRDPALAAAQLILRVNEIAMSSGETGRGTVGIIRSYPGAVNVVPASVEVSLDLRDTDPDRLRRLVDSVLSDVDTVCRSRGIEYSRLDLMNLEPTPLSRGIIDLLSKNALRMKIPHRALDSGAGHDCQNMTRISDAGMIFVRCRDGRSHSPLEWADWNDLTLGTDLMTKTVLDLAGADRKQ